MATDSPATQVAPKPEPIDDLSPEVYARRRHIAIRVVGVLAAVGLLLYLGYLVDHAGTSHSWVIGRVVETTPSNRAGSGANEPSHSQRGASRIEIPGLTFWRSGVLEQGSTVRVETSVGRFSKRTYVESVAADSVADLERATQNLRKSIEETERTIRALPSATPDE